MVVSGRNWLNRVIIHLTALSISAKAICIVVAVMIMSVSGRASDHILYEGGQEFTKPLKVTKGQLYAFEKLDAGELKNLAEDLKKKKKRAESPNASVTKVTAVPESFAVFMLNSAEYDVIKNDKSSSGKPLRLSRITEKPKYGKVTIFGNSVKYTSTEEFFGIDSFKYEVVDGSGGVDQGLVRVLVRHDLNRGQLLFARSDYEWEYGVFDPAKEIENKEERQAVKRGARMRQFVERFRIGIKPMVSVRDAHNMNLAVSFVTKGASGTANFPGGAQWNYPVDKFNSVGNPCCTQAVGCDEIRVHTDYIKKYVFNIDYEMHTLHVKEHWRLFVKFGEAADSIRSGWTGDMGFSIVPSAYHPVEKFMRKRTPGPLYKLTSYQGFTGIVEDRRDDELRGSGERTKGCLRVNLIVDDYEPGRKKLMFDFWPFLQFMIDHCNWVGGYPLTITMGSEIYNTATSDDNRAVGASLVKKFRHVVKTDLPTKKEVGVIKLSGGRKRIDLSTIMQIPSPPPIREDVGEAATFEEKTFAPVYKVVAVSAPKLIDATMRGTYLSVRSRKKFSSTVKVKVRVFDHYYQWYDEKTFEFKM